MCGIFGAFGDEAGLTRGILEKATATLQHRGPDGWRTWLADDHRTGLGHTRLSIIDLEGGAQPLQNETGRIHAVVNGEIYDFEKMRDELQAKGHRFSTASDSEVVIHLYEELGLESLHQLRGEYAFIIWDANNQCLIAVRDRFGVKPLYYSVYQGVLFLASEIKALIAAGVPAQWDEESFYIACHFGFTPLENRTLFKDVLQIPPGQVLTATKQHLRIDRYWDFNYPLTEMQNQPLSETEAIETFRSLFDEAVQLRLRADVPVGVYLSGGLDSCSILGTAAKFRGAGVKAFTIGFQDAVYDETAIAKEMAELSGAEFKPLLVTQEALALNFVESIRHCETITANPHTIAKFMLSKSVRDSGYKVVLTGEGADEILGGYSHFRQDLLLYTEEHGSKSHLHKSLRELKKKNVFSLDLSPNKAIDQNHPVRLSLGFVPSWLKVRILGAQKIKRFKLFSKDIRAQFSGLDPYRVFLDSLDIQNQLRGRHILNQSMYLWSKIMLPNYLLCSLGDRMEMAHSVEGRVPFLDHKLVEFTVNLPVSFKIRKMTEKYILREAAQPVISKTIYGRQKHPFIAPPATKKAGPMSVFIREYIGDHLQELPFFDRHKIGGILKLIDVIPAPRKEEIDSLLMMLASIVALQTEFGIR